MSDYVLPLLVLIVIISGLIKKIDIYDTFVKGAKESFKMILNMLIYLISFLLLLDLSCIN